MKRPSFQFYPADWRNNAKLRRCSWAARGAWIEVMGLLHDSDSYGILRWNLKEIAQAIGCPVSLIKELVEKGVLKGCDKGKSEALIYTPKSGRIEGNAVALIEEEQGPIWFSSRMVRDEYVRQNRGKSTRYDHESDRSDTPPKPSPKGGFGENKGESPNHSPSHWQSDGSTSSSSSSSNSLFVDNDVDNVRPLRPVKADCPHQEIIALYHEVLPMCPQVRDWGKKRQILLRARWNEAPERQNLDYWKRFFEYVATCDFLVGKKPGRGGDTFTANLEWMLQLSKFTNIREGHYSNREAS